MTLENPFFVVKDEVCKALNKNRGLYGRWSELQDVVTTPTSVTSGGIPISREELDWTTTELRKALRSIEWDLDDLQDTICIVEKNPSKFKIDNKELTVQRNFIEQTREEVKTMKDKMNLSRGRDRDSTARQVPAECWVYLQKVAFCLGSVAGLITKAMRYDPAFDVAKRKDLN